MERLAKAVRKKRADAEKAAAEAQHGMGLKQAAAQGDYTYNTCSDALLGADNSVANALGRQAIQRTALLGSNSGWHVAVSPDSQYCVERSCSENACPSKRMLTGRG